MKKVPAKEKKGSLEWAQKYKRREDVVLDNNVKVITVFTCVTDNIIFQ